MITCLHEPGLRDQVCALAHILRETVGGALLGAYVYGSAAAGGLRPFSDVDVLAVTDRPLVAGEAAALLAGVLPLSGRSGGGGPDRPLELTVLARTSLVPWRYPPALEFQFGEWMRAGVERGGPPPAPRADPDVAIIVETARRAALPLLGPPLAAITEPVPRSDLVRALIDTVPVLIPGIEEGDDVRNGLLTLARIWTTLATGDIRPKDAAAEFAIERLPAEHRPVLAHARAVYRGEAAEDWAGLAPRLMPHVRHVVGQIRAAAAGT